MCQGGLVDKTRPSRPEGSSLGVNSQAACLKAAAVTAAMMECDSQSLSLAVADRAKLLSAENQEPSPTWGPQVYVCSQINTFSARNFYRIVISATLDTKFCSANIIVLNNMPQTQYGNTAKPFVDKLYEAKTL